MGATELISSITNAERVTPRLAASRSSASIVSKRIQKLTGRPLVAMEAYYVSGASDVYPWRVHPPMSRAAIIGITVLVVLAILTVFGAINIGIN